MHAPDLKREMRRAVKRDLPDTSVVFVMRDVANRLQGEICDLSWLATVDFVEETGRTPAKAVDETTVHEMRALLFLMVDSEPEVMAIVVHELRRLVRLMVAYHEGDNDE